MATIPAFIALDEIITAITELVEETFLLNQAVNEAAVVDAVAIVNNPALIAEGQGAVIGFNAEIQALSTELVTLGDQLVAIAVPDASPEIIEEFMTLRFGASAQISDLISWITDIAEEVSSFSEILANIAENIALIQSYASRVAIAFDELQSVRASIPQLSSIQDFYNLLTDSTALENLLTSMQEFSNVWYEVQGLITEIESLPSFVQQFVGTGALSSFLWTIWNEVQVILQWLSQL